MNKIEELKKQIEFLQDSIQKYKGESERLRAELYAVREYAGRLKFPVDVITEDIIRSIAKESTTQPSANFSYVDVVVNLTAGVKILDKTPVRIGYDTSIIWDQIKDDNDTGGFQIAKDDTTINCKYIAQSFKYQGTFSIEKIKLKFSGKEASDVRIPYGRVMIQTDDDGKPSGTVLAQSDWKAVNMEGEETFDLTSSFQISEGTTYWIVFEIEEDTSNPGHFVVANGWNTYGYIYYIRFDSGAGYSDGKMLYKTSDSASWTSGGYDRDLCFFIQNSEEVGKLYPADSLLQGNVDRYLGFAPVGAFAGKNVEKIRKVGTLDVEGLTGSKVYYLTDQAGVIGTTSGTISKIVGVAITDTKLFLV